MHYSFTYILPLLCHIFLVSGQDGNFTRVPFPLSSSIMTTIVPSTATQSHTTLIPTPTHSPIPILQPDKPCYQVNTTNTSNIACVKMCLSHLNVTFGNTIAVLVPSKTIEMRKVSGMCPPDKVANVYKVSSMTIDWSDNTGNYNLTIQFRLNLDAAKDTFYKTKDEWYISAVSFSNGTKNFFSDFTHNATFGANKDQSYTCVSPLTLRLNTNNSNDTSATLKMSDYTIRAFGTFGTKNSFGSEANCVNSETFQYIPIIVGCALAGLVLLVLVAYVIGRCYTQKKGGYERLT